MAGNYTLGIDIGTTNVKASVLDTQTGQIVAHGSKDHPLYHPGPGYAEQDGDNYWSAVVAAVGQCLEQRACADDIAAVALSGLVGVMLPLDRDGRPVRRGMIWMDTRSEQECQDIRDTVGEERIHQVNGNRVAPWFVEPKALWMKKHEPENFKKTQKLLSPTGYCTYRLSGTYSINTGDAGLFYPYEFVGERWNESLPGELGLDPSLYPPIYQSHRIVGEVTRAAAQETGLRPGTTVVAGGTDISSAALGVGVQDAGKAFYSMGTGSNLGIMVPTEQKIPEYRILKWPHVLPGLTMFDAPMAFTGASLKWFHDQFGGAEGFIAQQAGLNAFDLIGYQAAAAQPGSGGLMYHPYLGNSLAPNWHSNACGMFFGVRTTTTRADFIRALIEGVAFDVNSNVETAKGAGVQLDKLVLNGGPTKSHLWNTITANVTNIPLDVPDIGEAAPLGDAILAAVGAGLYKDPTQPLQDIVTIKETIEPDPKLHAMYHDMYNTWRELYHNIKKDMDAHAAMRARRGLG